jgi:hypothetical protein
MACFFRMRIEVGDFFNELLGMFFKGGIKDRLSGVHFAGAFDA